MTDTELLFRLLIAVAFGAILGLETETRSNGKSELTNSARKKLELQRIGGVRTYTIIALFAAISGVLYAQGIQAFAYLTFITVAILVVAAYVLNVQIRGAFGMTTEVAILSTVLISFSATANIVPLQILFVFVVVLAFMLSHKTRINKITSNFSHEEIEDVAKFALISLVIFPFLPDVAIKFGQFEFLKNVDANLYNFLKDILIVNPLRLWQYIILMSGLNLTGYFAYKIFGAKRGLFLTGFFGGLVSSTAATAALAQHSREENKPQVSRRLAGAALIANATSKFTILALALSVGSDYFKAILPFCGIAFIISTITGYIHIKSGSEAHVSKEIPFEPFSLGPAIKFALIITIISLTVQLAEKGLGDTAAAIVAILSGFVNMDAATITIGTISPHLAGIAITVFIFVAANFVNYVAKILFSKLQGTNEYAKDVFWGLLGTFSFASIIVLIAQLI